ncbi:hypothetical protein IF2G_03338 [Cordyceps javanica]|nr:hypothetical protein IF2G_03338 [Cordyceps javanica]
MMRNEKRQQQKALFVCTLREREARGLASGPNLGNSDDLSWGKSHSTSAQSGASACRLLGETAIDVAFISTNQYIYILDTGQGLSDID